MPIQKISEVLGVFTVAEPKPEFFQRGKPSQAELWEPLTVFKNFDGKAFEFSRENSYANLTLMCGANGTKPLTIVGKTDN